MPSSVQALENPALDRLYLIGRQYGGFSFRLGPLQTSRAPKNFNALLPCYIYRGHYTGYYGKRRGNTHFDFFLDYSRDRNLLEYEDRKTRKWKPRDPLQLQVFSEIDHIVSFLQSYPLQDLLPLLANWEEVFQKSRAFDLAWIRILQDFAEPTHPQHNLYEALINYVASYKPGQLKVKTVITSFQGSGVVESEKEIARRIQKIQFPIKAPIEPYSLSFFEQNVVVTFPSAQDVLEVVAGDVQLDRQKIATRPDENYTGREVIATLRPGGFLQLTFDYSLDVHPIVLEAIKLFCDLERQHSDDRPLDRALQDMRNRHAGRSAQGRRDALRRLQISYLKDIVNNGETTPLERFALMIYLYGQLAVPKNAYDQGTSYILNWIRQNPKRLLSLWDAHDIVFERMNDRMTFARTLIQTSSIDKAFQAVFPKIEGVNRLKAIYTPILDLDGLPEPIPLIKGTDFRYTLNDFKSWPQLIAKFITAEEPDVRNTVQDALIDMLRLARSYRKKGYTSKEFQDMLRVFTPEQLYAIRDVLNTIPFYITGFAETIEGRRYIQMFENARGFKKLTEQEQKERLTSPVSITTKLRELARHHDAIMTYVESLPPGNKTVAQAEAHHSGALAFTMIPGVKPLVIQSDFREEKEAMAHCVYGFFWKFTSWIFSFRGAKGCKATLELSDKGEVVQFQSYQNTPPDAECNGMLREFLSVNSDLIKKLRQDAQPIKGKKRARQGEAAGNPFRDAIYI